LGSRPSSSLMRLNSSGDLWAVITRVIDSITADRQTAKLSSAPLSGIFIDREATLNGAASR
jgi:hypothetical protein